LDADTVAIGCKGMKEEAMKNPTAPDPDVGVVLSMPRPTPDWKAQTLEYVYLLGGTMWMGVQAATVLLIIPFLAQSTGQSIEAARLVVGVLELLGYVATGAAGILLIITVGMHFLRLRTPAVVLSQLILILLMTAVAVLPHLMMIPKLSSILRLDQVTGEGLNGANLNLVVQSTSGLGIMGLLHLFFGALLVSMGTRRCYRYPKSKLEEIPVWPGEDDR